MKRMPYDYSKLSGLITEKFGTRGAFAKAMGLSERSLSLKMNCERPWKQSEMIKASELLGFPLEELPLYFFRLKAQY